MPQDGIYGVYSFQNNFCWIHVKTFSTFPFSLEFMSPHLQMVMRKERDKIFSFTSLRNIYIVCFLEGTFAALMTKSVSYIQKTQTFFFFNIISVHLCLVRELYLQ